MGTQPKGRRSKPSFCKVLFGDFTNKLRVPPAFVKHLNGILPRQSFLRSPTGKSWTIMLKKIDNDLFFHNGWRAFASDHFLEVGDFLIFRYAGNSKFNVKIYGRTCCEKKAFLAKMSVRGTSNCKENPKQRETMKPEFIHNCQENEKKRAVVLNTRTCLFFKPRRTNTSTCSTGTRFKKESNFCATCSDKKLVDLNQSNWAKQIWSYNVITDFENERSPIHIHYSSTRRRKENNPNPAKNAENLREPGKGIGFQFNASKLTESTAFESEVNGSERCCQEVERTGTGLDNPWFTVKIHPTYLKFVNISIPSILVQHIPSSFCKKYLTQNLNELKLCGPDGRMWKAQFSFGRQAYICGGWRAFALAYNMRENDACSFELIKMADEVVLKVSISHDLFEEVPPQLDDTMLN